MPAAILSLELTTRSNPPVYPVDSDTGQAPAFWRGEDVDFRIGIFDRNGFPVDLSNLDFLEVDIFPLPIPNRQPDTNFEYALYSFLPFPSVPPQPLLTVTIPAVDITALIDRRGWEDGVEENAVGSIGWIDTQSLNLGGAGSKQFGLVVHGLTSTGKKITYGGGPIRVYETGEQGIYLPNSIAPLIVPRGTIFLIGVNSQIPFAAPIVIDGDMIVDGYLIEYGGAVPSGDFNPTDFNPSDFST